VDTSDFDSEPVNSTSDSNPVDMMYDSVPVDMASDFAFEDISDSESEDTFDFVPVDTSGTAPGIKALTITVQIKRLLEIFSFFYLQTEFS
jgi:hypothetical protein